MATTSPSEEAGGGAPLQASGPPGGYGGYGGYGPPPGGYGGYGGYGPPPGGYGGYGPPGGPAPPTQYLAGYGSRLAGWLIDWVLLSIVASIVEVPLDSIHAARWTVDTTSVSSLAFIVHVVIVILYGAILCGSSRGQTLGMMAVGVRAVDAASGGPIGFARGLGRAAFEYLLFVLLVVPWIVDVLWPLWDGANQTLHDKVSRTVVVRRNPGWYGQYGGYGR